MTVTRRSLWPWWVVWSTGVAILPLASVLVPRDGTPYPVVLFLPSLVGTLLWLSWGLALGLMFVGMLLLRAASVRTVVLAQTFASLFIATLTVAAPSGDPYSYVVYGQIAMHGENPWQPSRLPINDDATRIAAHSWGTLGGSTYGPLFILGERALAGVVPHTSTRTLILVQRYVAALAAVGVTLLVRGPRIAFWGLHPLVFFEFALGAHNDVLMLLLIAASMRIRHSFLSGIAIGLGAMVKIVAFGTLLFRPKKSIVPTLLGVAVAVIALLAIEPQAATLAPVLHTTGQHDFGQGGTLTYLIQKPLESLHVAHPRLVAQVSLISAVLVLLYRTRRRWSRRDAPLYGAMTLLAIAPILTSNYVSWILLPALWASRPIRGVALALTAAAWLLNLGFFSADHTHGITLAFWGTVALAYGYFFIVARPRHGSRPSSACAAERAVSVVR
jgi:hypothetical protein